MDEAFETMDPRGELHHQMLTALVAIDTACGSSDVGELPARSPPAGGIDAAVSAGLGTGLGRAVLQHSEVGELVAAPRMARSELAIATMSTTSCSSAPMIAGMMPKAAMSISTIDSAMPTQIDSLATRRVRRPTDTATAAREMSSRTIKIGRASGRERA